MIQNFQKFTLYLLLFFYCTACSNPKNIEINPIIVEISNQVSSPEIENTVEDLVAFTTRWTYNKQLDVADYLHNRVKEYLPNTYFYEYEFWGVNWKNVVATLPGRIHPEQVVIVCAHLDSKSEKRLVYAPGANDNASGCAAVLELARLFSQHSFEKSIRFIFFSREEYGWEGSAAYLKTIDRNKESIFATINLDMIAYGDDDEDIDLVTRPNYSWLVKTVENLANSYGFDVRKVVDEHCY